MQIAALSGRSGLPVRRLSSADSGRLLCWTAALLPLDWRRSVRVLLVFFVSDQARVNVILAGLVSLVSARVRNGYSTFQFEDSYPVGYELGLLDLSLA